MKKNKIILGSAMGLAAIAVAIDHTKHSLPTPEDSDQYMLIQADGDSSPCGMNESPCGMGEEESPCSMSPCDMTPCGMVEDESPCGMGDTPCGM